MPEGRQSPPPEEQSGKQGTDPTADGQGVNSSSNAKQESKNTLEGLESNPKHVLEDEAKAKVSKTVENNKS